MDDGRQALERESERFDLAPGAFDRFSDRRRRKDRNQRIRAGLGAGIIVAVLVWGALSMLSDVASHRLPASSPTSTPGGPPYVEIAGTYTVTLSSVDLAVSDQGMAGSYTMRLLPDGAVVLSAPVGSLREGTSPSGITYRLSAGQFTTNAFVNI